MSKRTIKCPECGTKVLRVVWGMPDSSLEEKAERGEVIIGGCCIDFYDRQCPECGWQNQLSMILEPDKKTGRVKVSKVEDSDFVDGK